MIFPRSSPRHGKTTRTGRPGARPGRTLGLVFLLLGGVVACHRQGAPPAAAKPEQAQNRDNPPGRGTAGGSGKKSPLPDFAVDAVATREGEAIWYDVPERSLPERRAWAGEMTAASDVLPLNAYVRVHRLEGGETDKPVIVRITDDGVHEKGALVDVNKEAAEALGMVKAGKVRVRLEVLALKNADADKPVEKKEEPNGPKLDTPAASAQDEKRAAREKTGE